MGKAIAVLFLLCVICGLDAQNINRPDSVRLIGEWLSDERVEGQPRAAVTVRQDGGLTIAPR